MKETQILLAGYDRKGFKKKHYNEKRDDLNKMIR